jgi:hypothetical protein
LLSPSVKSIACGRHGGSSEATGARAERALTKKAAAQGPLVPIMPRLSCVGVPLFAQWRDPHETFGPVVAQLTQALEAHKHAHPGDDFALVPHRESTLLRRFPALVFAPLWGIDRRTAFATHAHPLATLLGRGSHSATLSQFLGQLERVGAAEVVRPALVPAQTGPITDVDGPMVA